jgi:hypothetical protein
MSDVKRATEEFLCAAIGSQVGAAIPGAKVLPRTGFGLRAIATVAAGNPAVVTTVSPHHITDQSQVAISGVQGIVMRLGQEAINGKSFTATVIFPVDGSAPISFSIPVDVLEGGAGGTVEAEIEPPMVVVDAGDAAKEFAGEETYTIKGTVYVLTHTMDTSAEDHAALADATEAALAQVKAARTDALTVHGFDIAGQSNGEDQKQQLRADLFEFTAGVSKSR